MYYSTYAFHFYNLPNYLGAGDYLSPGAGGGGVEGGRRILG